MDVSGPPKSHDFLHKFLAVGAGAAGGYLGPLTLLVELPFTTTLMLRSIADIARSYGEDLRQDAARLACVQVFALGARTRDDEAADVGYYALRTILGFHFERDIVQYAVGVKGPHIPAFIELTQAIAARFGVVISEHVAVKMVPIAGAISGAGLNLIFMKHFQDVARGHFIVRNVGETVRHRFDQRRVPETRGRGGPRDAQLQSCGRFLTTYKPNEILIKSGFLAAPG